MEAEVVSALALIEELSVRSSDSGLSEETCWDLFGGPCPQSLRKKSERTEVDIADVDSLSKDELLEENKTTNEVTGENNSILSTPQKSKEMSLGDEKQNSDTLMKEQAVEHLVQLSENSIFKEFMNTQQTSNLSSKIVHQGSNADANEDAPMASVEKSSEEINKNASKNSTLYNSGNVEEVEKVVDQGNTSLLIQTSKQASFKEKKASIEEVQSAFAQGNKSSLIQASKEESLKERKIISDLKDIRKVSDQANESSLIQSSKEKEASYIEVVQKVADQSSKISPMREASLMKKRSSTIEAEQKVADQATKSSMIQASKEATFNEKKSSYIQGSEEVSGRSRISGKNTILEDIEENKSLESRMSEVDHINAIEGNKVERSKSSKELVGEQKKSLKLSKNFSECLNQQNIVSSTVGIKETIHSKSEDCLEHNIQQSKNILQQEEKRILSASKHPVGKSIISQNNELKEKFHNENDSIDSQKISVMSPVHTLGDDNTLAEVTENGKNVLTETQAFRQISISTSTKLISESKKELQVSTSSQTSTSSEISSTSYESNSSSKNNQRCNCRCCVERQIKKYHKDKKDMCRCVRLEATKEQFRIQAFPNKAEENRKHFMRIISYNPEILDRRQLFCNKRLQTSLIDIHEPEHDQDLPHKVNPLHFNQTSEKVQNVKIPQEIKYDERKTHCNCFGDHKPNTNWRQSSSDSDSVRSNKYTFRKNDPSLAESLKEALMKRNMVKETISKFEERSPNAEPCRCCNARKMSISQYRTNMITPKCKCTVWQNY